MPGKKILSEGKNVYKDNVFDWQEWSTQRMVSPEEIEDRIESMNLVGRTIEDVRLVGYSYWHSKDWIEETAYGLLSEDMDEAERQEKSEYNNISEDLTYERYVVIDDPFLIKFTDGNVFEIELLQVPEYKFSMNCIPWNISPGKCSSNNVDASIVFSPALGKEIVEVEVAKDYVDADPMTCEKFDEAGTKREIVTHIVLWLENGVGICVGGFVDYCEVLCINRKGEVLPIPFGELRKALRN